MQSSKTDRILKALIGGLLVVLVAVVADTLREHVIGVGDTAPEFEIQTDSGLVVSRSNFGGKVLVLNFWATWCPPCIEEIPSLNAFHQKLKDEGVVVLGISVDEDEGAYRRFLEGHKVQFLTARDPAAEISSRFGTYRYPETYIIDSNGTVRQKIIGAADWSDQRMIDYVRSLL